MDRKLQRMEETKERALNPRRALGLLKETCKGSNWEILRLLDAEDIKHWPGKRLTVRYKVKARCGGENAELQTLFGKLYRSKRGEQSYRILQFLNNAKTQSLLFPEPLGYNTKRRFLLMSGLEGVPLRDLLREPSARIYLELLARGLASLHGLGPKLESFSQEILPAWRRHTIEEEALVLNKALIRMEESGLPTSLIDEFKKVLRFIQDKLAFDDPNYDAIIHRDLYPRQIICDSGKVGIVDLDEACLGEAEQDLGNFIAHLKLADIQEQGYVKPETDLDNIFLSAYCSMRPFSEIRLAVHQSASLLRLASLERLSLPEISIHGWDRLAAALIQSARDILI